MPLPLAFLFGTLLVGPATACEPSSAPSRPATPTLEATSWMPYAGTLAEAREGALERNAPICLMLVLEDVESNDRFVEKVLESKLLAERSRDYLPLWGNNGEHGTAPFEVGRDEAGEPILRELCKRFRTPTCEAHQAVLDAAWGEFADSKGGLECPRVIVLKPDGTVHAALFTGQPIEDKKIVASIDAVIKTVGAPLSVEELARVHAAIEAAAIAREAYAAAEEWRQWQRVLDTTETAHWADRARGGQKDALAILQAEFDDTVALEAGGPVQAYKAWHERLAAWNGTPLVEAIEARMKALEKSKETRDEIRAWKRTQEAQAMLDEAMEFVKDGEEKKAERVVKKLLRKYADTPAGERAAKKWPHLVTK